MLGTVAALGLSQSDLPWKKTIMAIILSPMIVPIVITSAGFYFFFSAVGLSHTYLGIILAHALLGVPFVVITVTATLSSFDAPSRGRLPAWGRALSPASGGSRCP